jgi:two-component system, sensor histidine kinase LadS
MNLSSIASRLAALTELCTRWLVALLLLWTALPSSAADHITARAWTNDPTGQLTIEQVQTLPMQPYTGLLSKGYGQSALWMRLRIDPQLSPINPASAQQLILRIRPVYLDEITIYDPQGQPGWMVQTGDLVHPRNDPVQGLNFLVPVPRGEMPRDIWVRLKSTSTRQIDIQALNPHELGNIVRLEEVVSALYFGLVLIFTLWGTTYWLFSREGIIGAFALMQASAMFYAFFSLGFARTFWPDPWPAWLLSQSTSFWSITAVSSAVVFHVLMTHEYGLPKWLQRLLYALVAMLPVKLTLLFTGYSVVGLQLNMLEVLIAPLLFLMAAMLGRAWRHPDPEQRPVLNQNVSMLFYGSMTLLLLMAAMPGLAIGRATEFTIHIVQVHGMLTALIILLVLQYRAHVLQQKHREDQLSLKASQYQAQHERGIREEREQLLAMLTHELKTPLATMQMRVDPNARGEKEIKQAIRDMNDVIERCLQTLQMSEQQLATRIEYCDLVDILKEVSQASQQPWRIQLDAPDTLLVQSDRQLLFIVASNLVQNATKYAAPDTPITLQLHTEGPYAQLQIGNLPGQAGWPDPMRVFEKYYRSPHAKRQTGTGLGLYLVKHILNTLGGNIALVSDPERVKFVVNIAMTAPPSLSH